MNTASDHAALGLLVMCAADMYTSFPDQIAPPVDGRLGAGWTVVGYLTANDAIFRRGQTIDKGKEVCYGFLACSKADPLEYVAAVRGTAGIVEWIEDGQFVLRSHPTNGRVEGGFWDIYTTMLLKANTTDTGQTAALGIAAAVAPNATVTVIGHSLGSALATYLAFDLAGADRLGARASACLFASPHPGDTDFAKAFDARVGQYVLYNYFLDAVPRVPFGPDYDHLPRVTDLRPSEVQARIRFELPCSHHIVCYCAMLDYAQTDASPKISSDQSCVACIRGPAGAN